METVLIDGAAGEGGGQILRTALTLSLLSARPFQLSHIRARRSRPGLMPQHLMAVRAAAALCSAEVSGDTKGGSELRFTPGELHPGTYRFDIGTAGSTALLAQTLVPALALQPVPSRLTLVGGTHVPMSPCFHYLLWQWLPYLQQIGWHLSLRMERAGFYPRGGGVLSLAIEPSNTLQPLAVQGRGSLLGISGLSAVANLPHHIVRRQRLQAERRLVQYGPRIEERQLAAYGPGTVLALLARFERGSGCYFALGERGKPAEQVADEAVDGLLGYLHSEAGVDRYLTDQLLLPLALVPGRSTFTGERLSNHLRTNAEVIRAFLPAVGLQLKPLDGGRVQVVIDGAAISRG